MSIGIWRTNMLRFLCFALIFFAGLWISAQGSEEGVPASIKLDPVTDTNPIKTQHTIVATVLDANNNPLPNQRVEWILARGPVAVGDIVEHDDMNAIVGSDQKVTKLGNHYTVTYTNDRPMVLDFGTSDTRDDINLNVGDTWLTITSPLEGETHIIAFCPGIKNANNHKTFGVKYWMDAKIDWPEDAVNKVGTPHTFQFKLTKASNSAPLPGYRVKWELVDGVPGYLNEPDTKVVEGQTNEEGESSVVLNQVEPAEGSNTVKITLQKPTGEFLAIRTAVKTWLTPRLLVQKEGPTHGILNEKVTYTITVSNPGDETADDVVLIDTLPEGLSYSECSIAPDNVEGKVLTWNLGSMAKNESKKFLLTTKAEKEGVWKNAAEVRSRQSTPPPVYAETEIGAPDLYIVKNGPDEIRKDNMATYTITLNNKGNAEAKDVQVLDNIPAGMDYRGRTSGYNMRWNPITLQPGESKAYSYQLKASQVGIFTNVAKLTMKGKEIQKDEHKTKVIAPNMKLTKDGPSRVILNKPVEYTITVSNTGDAVAYDMVVIDTLPGELEFMSAVPEPNNFKNAADQQLATATWKLGDIQPEQTITITLKVRAISIARCRNTAKLFSNSSELPIISPLEAYVDTTIQGVPAMHINTYDTEDPVEIGKQTIYVIETRNEGTSACTNIQMESLIDEEMEFVSAQGPVPFKVNGNTITFDPVPILQPAEKLTYKVTARAIKEGSAKHKATLRYAEFDKPIMNEEGTNCYK